MAIITVTELNRYVKRMIDCDPVLGRIMVKGELSNCKLHYSGHLYFALKDESSVVRGVMFKSSVSCLHFHPENGQKVIISGKISVYERDGQYQLYAEEMQPDGIGALHLAYEQLKQKLESEGLFRQERKKALPAFPRHIGVITSPTGAAIRDIINILSRRYQLADVYLYPVLVQGAEAPADLIQAIHYFHTTGWADVLIIGRGGGSIEDLWAFNDEGVARAIADCRIPVISAVGHETDFTIADFAADLRAPTPSAAAELAVPSQLELEERFSGYYLRLRKAYLTGVEQRRELLKSIVSRRIYTNPLEPIQRRQLDLDRMVQQLTRETEQTMNLRRERLGALAEKLQALSPLSVLSRGYTTATDKTGILISRAEQLKQGQEISLMFADGTADCTVTKIKKTEATQSE